MAERYQRGYYCLFYPHLDGTTQVSTFVIWSNPSNGTPLAFDVKDNPARVSQARAQAEIKASLDTIEKELNVQGITYTTHDLTTAYHILSFSALPMDGQVANLEGVTGAILDKIQGVMGLARDRWVQRLVCWLFGPSARRLASLLVRLDHEFARCGLGAAADNLLAGLVQEFRGELPPGHSPGRAPDGRI